LRGCCAATASVRAPDHKAAHSCRPIAPAIWVTGPRVRRVLLRACEKGYRAARSCACAARRTTLYGSAARRDLGPLARTSSQALRRRDAIVAARSDCPAHLGSYGGAIGCAYRDAAARATARAGRRYCPGADRAGGASPSISGHACAERPGAPSRRAR